MTTKRRPKFYGYVRVSTQMQADSGLSLDNQRAVIEARYKSQYAAEYDWGGICEDKAISAKTPLLERKAGAAMSRATERGDLIAVADGTRAFRSGKDFVVTVDYWQQIGVEFLDLQKSIDTRSAHGRMMLGIFALVAAYERECISIRTREAMARRKLMGYTAHAGPCPFGFLRKRHNGKWRYVSNPEDRMIGGTVVRFKDAHGLTYIQMWQELRRLGVLRRGKEMSPSFLYRSYLYEHRLRQAEAEKLNIGDRVDVVRFGGVRQKEPVYAEPRPQLRWPLAPERKAIATTEVEGDVQRVPDGGDDVRGLPEGGGPAVPAAEPGGGGG